MATDPRDVAETIARQRRQLEEAQESLRATFQGVAGWRRAARRLIHFTNPGRDSGGGGGHAEGSVPVQHPGWLPNRSHADT